MTEINYLDQELHGYKVEVVEQQMAVVLVSAFNLVPVRVGSQWCYLLGENIQEGVAGFGDSPYEAAIDFNKDYHRKTNTDKKGR